jgi:flagellar biosynthesis/type III secretory pathway protein FliH
MQFTDRQEKWGYILANINHMEPQDLSQEDEVFRSVFEDSMHQKLTNMEKEEYKKSVLEYKDVQAAVQYAHEQGEKLGYDSGFGSGYDSGVEHGIKQGIKQGIEQGIERGIEQANRLKDDLFIAMKKDNRLDDYAKSVQNKEYYEKLLKEYGLLIEKQ